METFGRYELLELIGRGGMGEVYRARDTQHHRVVALKVLPHHLASDELFAARFRRESQLAAQLNEPHIIPIHDFGEIDGRLFIDMRLVVGSDLSSVIRQHGSLPAGVAAGIVAQVASALDAAHAEGLLHRDVKPSNVMLTGVLDDLVTHPPFAYLVDFGIARSTVQQTALTDASSPIGTAAYMSPERIAGEIGDGRGDVYALACLLYECLTGRPPFEGELVPLMYQHLHAEPPKPSANPSVPAGLDAVVSIGMAKEPAQRYATAGALGLAARRAAEVGRTLPPAGRDDATRIVANVMPPGPPPALRPTTAPPRRPRPRPAAPRSLRSNLPATPGDLVGRTHERAELVELLSGTERLVTITGPGGTGKTTLGLAVADALLERRRDGAFLIELAEVARADEVPAAIAAVLGVGVGDLTATLAGRELLLMLDNFEHVIDAAPFVGRLLEDAPELRILVTSQAPLRLAAERIVPLPPLARTAAADLLAARAGRNAVQLDHADAGVIDALCRELDGSPLAIELAAARLSVLSPLELLERLRRSVDALGTGRRDQPGRHRGLRAAMQWSYDLLDDDAKTLFRRLGHFAGPVSLERVESVAGEGLDPLDAISALAEMSLVRRRDDGRFELASALRTFARELLDAAERDELRRRHADVIVAEWLPDGIRFFFSYRAREAAVLVEMPDVLALTDWAAESDRSRFCGLIAVSFNVLQQLNQLDRFRAPIGRSLVDGWCSGRMRLVVQLAAYALDHSATIDLVDASYEADAGFEGGFLATYSAARLLGGDPSVADQVDPLVERLSSWPTPPVQHTVPVLRAMQLYARADWPAAAVAVRAALCATSGGWLDKFPLYLLGDCELFAEQPARALTAFGRGFGDGLERRVMIDTAFQGEGIVASLVDLGRFDDALEALGAVDNFTVDGAHPREQVPAWGAMIETRIDRARSTLGAAADAAYERGRRGGLAAAATVLLTLSGDDTATVV